MRGPATSRAWYQMLATSQRCLIVLQLSFTKCLAKASCCCKASSVFAQSLCKDVCSFAYVKLMVFIQNLVWLVCTSTTELQNHSKPAYQNTCCIQWKDKEKKESMPVACLGGHDRPWGTCSCVSCVEKQAFCLSTDFKWLWQL